MANLDLEEKHSSENEEITRKNKKRVRDEVNKLKNREIEEENEALIEKEPKEKKKKKKKLKQRRDTDDEENEAVTAVSDDETKKKKKKKKKDAKVKFEEQNNGEEGEEEKDGDKVEETSGSGIMTNETFESLGLSDNTFKCIKEMGFQSMTQVIIWY